MTNLPGFTTRLQVITGVFFILLLVIVLRAVQIAWISQQKYLRAGEKISLRFGKIPARRGELHDRKNVLLAWNERHFELWSTLSGKETFSNYQLDVLAKKFPERAFPLAPGNKAPILYQLTPREVMELEPLIKRGFPLRVRSKVDRLTINAPGLKEKIGSVQNGVGVSGWEKQYDHLLRGQDGEYSVLLDRRRNWIPSSWKMLKEPVHGRNAAVPFDLNRAGKRRSRNK